MSLKETQRPQLCFSSHCFFNRVRREQSSWTEHFIARFALGRTKRFIKELAGTRALVKDRSSLRRLLPAVLSMLLPQPYALAQGTLVSHLGPHTTATANGMPAASSAGQVPMSTSAGTAYVATSLGSAALQPATAFDAAGTGFCGDQKNGIFHPACFAATGSGNTLISQADAAFNAAVAYSNANGNGAVIELGAVVWPICNAQQGWILPQATGATGNGVNIAGINGTSSVLAVSCPIHRTALPSGAAAGSPISQAALWQPVPAQPHLTSYHWHDFALYALGKASATWDMEGDIYLSRFENMSLSGAAGDGSAQAYSVRFGNSSYPTQAQTFQSTFDNIVVTAGTTQGAGAAFTVSGSNGNEAVAVTSGGQNYGPNTVVYLSGAQPQGAGGPCSYVPNAGLKPTIVGGVIQSVTVVNQYYGCSGPIYAQAYDPGYPVQYGIWFDRVTDSSTYHLQPTLGVQAAFYSNGANNRYTDTHVCCSLPVGIVESGTNDWDKTEFDSDGLYGMQFYGTSASNVTNSLFLWNGSFPGSNGYFFQSSGNGRIANDTCWNAQAAGGYHQIVSAIGVGISPTGWDLIANQECAGMTKVTTLTGIVAHPLTTPASSGAACTTGQMEDDANYHYVCTAPNTWKRVALTPF